MYIFIYIKKEKKIKTFRRIKFHKAVFHSYKAPTSLKKKKQTKTLRWILVKTNAGTWESIMNFCTTQTDERSSTAKQTQSAKTDQNGSPMPHIEKLQCS